MRPRRTSQGQRKTDKKTVSQVKNGAILLAEHYDAKIDALSDEIRKLRESRNADCSATRNLPAEILSMIFQRLSASKGYQFSLSWTSVTHVCRKWRHIALGEPRLWTNTVSLSESWLKLFLDRAKTAPLKLLHVAGTSYDSDSSFSSASEASSDSASTSSSISFLSLSSYSQRKANTLLEGLFHSPERLGELKLVGCDKKIINRLNRPAPNLTALNIRGKVTLSQKFLGNSAPRLQSFTLRKGSVCLNASWLGNLRTLKLAGHWRLCNATGKSVAITISSFLECLGALEKLEDLSVSFRALDETDRRKYSGPLIQLPKLRNASFSFVIETSYLSDLFNHVQLPVIHRFDVQWPFNFSDSARMDKVSALFVKSTGQPFRRISCSALLHYRGCSVELNSGAGEPFLSFGNISIASGLPFQNSNTIEELEFHASSLLLQLLEASTVPYPSLRQLEIHAGDLKPKTRTIPALRRWLKIRNSPIKRIEKLIISGSEGLSEKDVASLEKLVRVTWNR